MKRIILDIILNLMLTTKLDFETINQDPSEFTSKDRDIVDSRVKYFD